MSGNTSGSCFAYGYVFGSKPKKNGSFLTNFYFGDDEAKAIKLAKEKFANKEFITTVVQRGCTILFHSGSQTLSDPRPEGVKLTVVSS